MQKLTRSIQLLIAMAAALVAAEANAQDRCARLDAQLQAVDQAPAAAPERAAQYRDAIDRQSEELDRTRDYARSIGCEIDPGSDDQCSALASNIRRMKRNLSNLEAQYGRIADNAGEHRRGERERILAMLDDLGCHGASGQPRQARSAGLFERLFGSDEAAATYEPPPSTGDQAALEPLPDGATASTNLRTICVRKCDGFFFPISFSTSSESFVADEEACRQRCPAAEVELYAYNTFSEQPDNAVSATTGRPLSDLPNAFKFRTSFNDTCSCKPAGQTWAQVLGVDKPLSPAEEALKRLDEADLSPTGRDKTPKPKSAPTGEAAAKTDGGQAAAEAPADPALVQGRVVETTTPDGKKKKLRIVGPEFSPKS